MCVERAPALEGWKAWRWAGRTRGVWRDIFPLFFSASVALLHESQEALQDKWQTGLAEENKGCELDQWVGCFWTLQFVRMWFSLRARVNACTRDDIADIT